MPLVIVLSCLLLRPARSSSSGPSLPTVVSSPYPCRPSALVVASVDWPTTPASDSEVPSCTLGRYPHDTSPRCPEAL